MANEENLKGHGFHERTAREQREIAAMGGRASGEKRRKKADFRKALHTLLTTPIDHPEWTPLLEAMGLESTLETALNMAMIKEGLEGNVRAYEAIAKFTGQSTMTDASEEEQRIRTDRARRARDMEVGDNNPEEENIKSFLRAMRPEENDLKDLYQDEGEEGDVEETEETGEI